MRDAKVQNPCRKAKEQGAEFHPAPRSFPQPTECRGADSVMRGGGRGEACARKPRKPGGRKGKRGARAANGILMKKRGQILVLEDGEMAGIGTHAELMESCEIYREIYESQFETKKNQNAAGAETEKGVMDHGTDK